MRIAKYKIIHIMICALCVLGILWPLFLVTNAEELPAETEAVTEIDALETSIETETALESGEKLKQRGGKLISPKEDMKEWPLMWGRRR